MSKKNKRGAPVVIVRKDKRLGKIRHLTAFALTGGASSVYTAAKAATNAGYNARTRKLADAAEEQSDDAYTSADHERALRAGRAAMQKQSGRPPTTEPFTEAEIAEAHVRLDE